MFKIPGFLLYIDIRASCCSVLRPLLYETGATEDGIAKLVLLLDLPLGPLLETLRQASALEQANLPKHAQALTASLYDGLWWQIRGHLTAAVPKRGFCPGTGIADLAFTLVYRLVLSGIHDRLRDFGIGVNLRCSQQPIFGKLLPGELVGNFDASWVDDTVIMSSVPGAENIASLRSNRGYCFLATPEGWLYAELQAWEEPARASGNRTQHQGGDYGIVHW